MVLPFALLRLGLMAGNWGQHAFVDDEDPDSDYRSSITTIDVTVRPLSLSPDLSPDLLPSFPLSLPPLPPPPSLSPSPLSLSLTLLSFPPPPRPR